MSKDSGFSPKVNKSNGEIINFPKKETKGEYVSAIRQWLTTRDLAETLSRDELAAMPMLNRLDAQRKAIIIHLASYYRKHRRADVAPGVLTITILLSDNDKGACSMTQEALGRLLDRHPSAIREAQKKIREIGAVSFGRGCRPLSYPIVPRVVVSGYNHVIWLAEAVSNPPAGLADCESADGSSGLDQSADGSSGLQEGNPLDKHVESAGGSSAYFSNSEYYSTGASARACETQDCFTKAAAGVAVALATTAMLGATDPAAATPLVDPPPVTQLAEESLFDRLCDAGGKALANPAAAPGLIVLSEPHRWLENGCDLDKDILPAIRARAARAQPGSIRAWSYFTSAVADARATRIKGMPEGRAQQRKRAYPASNYSYNGTYIGRTI